MSTMVTMYKFDTSDGAEQMLNTVEDLSEQQSIILDDAAIVTWQAGTEKPKIKHLNDMASSWRVKWRILGHVFRSGLFHALLGYGHWRGQRSSHRPLQHLWR